MLGIFVLYLFFPSLIMNTINTDIFSINIQRIKAMILHHYLNRSTKVGFGAYALRGHRRASARAEMNYR